MWTLSARPCERTVALTLAPATNGAPTLTESPSPTASTSANWIAAPTSACRSSTLSFSPELTRYCFPPVLMTAYMTIPLCGSFVTAWHQHPAGRLGGSYVDADPENLQF